MTRHEIIHAGRGKRPVRVERPRKRKIDSAWSRKIVHMAGLAAVADELGVAALLPLGGLMTSDRMLRLLVRRQPDRPICQPARPICHPKSAPAPGLGPDLSTEPLENQAQIIPEMMPGLLAEDIARLIRVETGTFGRALWGEVL